MTNAVASVVGKAVYEPFGTVSSITGAASNAMRIPGQWFQLEAGLHHNWWRHYDPTTGRYTTADPLGLSQGPAPAYADADAAVPSNANPGLSLAALGLPGASGRQAGLLAGLASLGAEGRQGPLGLGTDFAAPFNPGQTVARDGRSLYAYAGLSPMTRTDRLGLP